MRNRKHALLATAAAFALVFSSVPVMASNYTAIPGGTTNCEKVMIVDNDAEIPAAEFEFTATAGAAIEATATTVKVWAGKNPELVKVNGEAQTGSVEFTAGEAKTAGAANDTYANSADKSYAKKTIALDFSAISYSEPGAYRYIITEADPEAPISVVGQKATTIDVYVQDVNGALQIMGYVAYDGVVTVAPKVATGDTPIGTLDGKTPNGAEAGTKDDKFRNELATNELEFGKEVTGNQGSKDQYFAFTLTLNGLGAGTVLTAVPSDNDILAPHANDATSFDVEDMTEANTRDDNATKTGQQLVADENGAVTWTVYLHDGQYIKVKGIPEGATYAVTEADAAGYTKTEGIAASEGKGGVAYEDDVEGTFEGNVKTGYTNTRNGVLPTGVMVAVIPGAIAIAAGLGGAFALKKKRRDNDEE